MFSHSGLGQKFLDPCKTHIRHPMYNYVVINENQSLKGNNELWENVETTHWKRR